MKASVVDYGVGNILNVVRAFEYLGFETEVINEKKQLEKAQKIILPGVGAFSQGMKNLQRLNLIDSLRSSIQKDQYLLGICLGMQLLFKKGHEFVTREGLGILPGEVCPIQSGTFNGEVCKVPHVGWSELNYPEGQGSWRGKLFSGLDSNVVYFIHSYSVETEEKSMVLAECNYAGKKLVAAVQSKNIFACQFHPEKSGKTGLKILKNFMEL